MTVLRTRHREGGKPRVKRMETEAARRDGQFCHEMSRRDSTSVAARSVSCSARRRCGDAGPARDAHIPRVVSRVRATGGEPRWVWGGAHRRLVAFLARSRRTLPRAVGTRSPSPPDVPRARARRPRPRTRPGRRRRGRSLHPRVRNAETRRPRDRDDERSTLGRAQARAPRHQEAGVSVDPVGVVRSVTLSSSVSINFFCEFVKPLLDFDLPPTYC